MMMMLMILLGDNISMLLDNRSIDVVYKNRRKNLTGLFHNGKILSRALEIYEEIANLDEDIFAKVNSDKVPVVLANKYINDFDYNVCKKIIREVEKNARKQNSNPLFSVSSLIDVDDIVPQQVGIWYHQKKERRSN